MCTFLLPLETPGKLMNRECEGNQANYSHFNACKLLHGAWKKIKFNITLLK